MEALIYTGYMTQLIGITCAVGLVLTIMGRMALAAVLIAPLTLNIILFHVFLDDSIINQAAIPAYVLLLTNVYFLWVNRSKYQNLW